MPDPVRLNGMTSAAGSLAMLERRQQVLANNLANVSTSGFKGEHVFARLVDNAVAVADTRVDLTPGTITETGNALDLALEGDGFLVVNTPNGERHTRGGSFRMDGAGRVLDGSGNALMGEAGELTLPTTGSGKLQINGAGVITVDGRSAGQLRVERIPPGSSPQHEGGVLFVPGKTRESIPIAERRVKQGFTEDSNVNPMNAMTAMLEVLHRFGAAQKTISTLDSVRGIAVNELGKPA